MARPFKEGLEYFPLDCDIDQNDKIALIEAQHGIVGFGVAIKLLMKIYNNSYFYEWTEKEQLLFSRRVNVNINEVNVIINDLVKWDFFDEKLFKDEKILTSKGIQRRYLEAVGRRQKVKMLKKYLLLDEDIVNVYKNLVIVDINPFSSGVNDNISTQSKVKKSKVKESKEKNNNCCSLYEKLGFGTINEVTLSDIDLLIDEYTEIWVMDAMKEANAAGVRNLKYVTGILKNWKSKGRRNNNTNDSTRKNIRTSKIKINIPKGPELTDEDRKRAEQELI